MAQEQTGREVRWAERIRQGDEEAFAEMVRACYADLFDFACSYTRVPEAAEDLVQEVLLNVWERRHTWHPQGSPRAYLFGAVRNRALNVLRDRRTRRAEVLDARGAAAEGDEDPEQALRYRELVQDYRAAVAALPERRRLVFRLSRLYGLTYEEVAEVMGISLNTVRTQMTAALKHLRARLTDHLYTLL